MKRIFNSFSELSANETIKQFSKTKIIHNENQLIDNQIPNANLIVENLTNNYEEDHDSLNL